MFFQDDYIYLEFSCCWILASNSRRDSKLSSKRLSIGIFSRVYSCPRIETLHKKKSKLCFFFLKLNFIITLLQRSSFLCQEHFVFPVYQSWLQRLGLTWENDIFSFHELVYRELCSTSLGPEPRGLGLII